MEYLAPGSVKDAITLLAKSRGAACVMAGGTDVLPRAATGRMKRPRQLVSLRDVPGLDRITAEAKGFIRIGAGVTLAEVARSGVVLRRFAAVAEAAAMVGSEQVRSTATLVGNICSASSAADTIPPLLCAQAVVEVVGKTGRRLVPIDRLLAGPRKVSLKAGELVVAIRIPIPKGKIGTVYRRHGTRSAMDCATVIAAAQVTARKYRIIEARLALGAVHPVPLRCQAAEEILADQVPIQALLAQAAEAAAAEINPISDIRASADHRRAIVLRMMPELIHEAFVRAGGTRS